MKQTLKAEEIVMTLAALYFLYIHNLGLSVWIWLLQFFSPDISMLGYLFGNTVGAICYNIFHHKGIALFIVCLGFFVSNEILLAAGALLFAHSSFDRVFGFGLKYFSGFKNTHLGNL